MGEPVEYSLEHVGLPGPHAVAQGLHPDHVACAPHPII